MAHGAGLVIHLCCWHCRNRRHNSPTSHTLLLPPPLSSSSSLSTFDFGAHTASRRQQQQLWVLEDRWANNNEIAQRAVPWARVLFLHLYFYTIDLISDSNQWVANLIRYTRCVAFISLSMLCPVHCASASVCMSRLLLRQWKCKRATCNRAVHVSHWIDSRELAFKWRRAGDKPNSFAKLNFAFSINRGSHICSDRYVALVKIAAVCSGRLNEWRWRHSLFRPGHELGSHPRWNDSENERRTTNVLQIIVSPPPRRRHHKPKKWKVKNENK